MPRVGNIRWVLQLNGTEEGGSQLLFGLPCYCTFIKEDFHLGWEMLLTAILTLMGCPVRWCSHSPWNCIKTTWVWHLGIGSSGEHGGGWTGLFERSFLPLMILSQILCSFGVDTIGNEMKNILMKMPQKPLFNHGKWNNWKTKEIYNNPENFHSVTEYL